jgi:small subunit ribosomal protein S13
MRLIGTTIPDEKRLEYALTYIYGIGHASALKILAQAKISPDRRAKSLTPAEINVLRGIIDHDYKIEGELRRMIAANIKRMRDIRSYRGMRHARSLPVRGQRTRTNSRTRRGNVRRTMGSGKRKVEKK